MDAKNLDTLRIIVPGPGAAPGGEARPGAETGPGHNFHEVTPEEIQANRETLIRKAKRKDMTRQVNRFLVKLEHSNLVKYYERAGRCGRIMKQEGDKITTWYCQCRHCLNCCAIRTAKLINAYMGKLRNLDEPYMLTLTIPDAHVGDANLKATAEKMIANWRTVYSHVRKKWFVKEAIEVQGFRGFECTGSWLKKEKRHKYHPHFHIIVDGLAIAQDMRTKWLQLNPGATEINQRIVPANEGSMKEILKYFTKFFDKKYRTVTTRDGKKKKVCYKKEINIHRLDVMMQSFDGLRLFNAFGIKKLIDDEEEEIFDNLEAQTYDDVEVAVTKWFWHDVASDWVDITSGETLAGNTRSIYEQDMMDAIRPCGNRKLRIGKRKRRKVDRLTELSQFDTT